MGAEYARSRGALVASCYHVLLRVFIMIHWRFVKISMQPCPFYLTLLNLLFFCNSWDIEIVSSNSLLIISDNKYNNTIV